MVIFCLKPWGCYFSMGRFVSSYQKKYVLKIVLIIPFFTFFKLKYSKHYLFSLHSTTGHVPQETDLSTKALLLNASGNNHEEIREEGLGGGGLDCTVVATVGSANSSGSSDVHIVLQRNVIWGKGLPQEAVWPLMRQLPWAQEDWIPGRVLVGNCQQETLLSSVGIRASVTKGEYRQHPELSIILSVRGRRKNMQYIRS